jgi:hypothetical protein
MAPCSADAGPQRPFSRIYPASEAIRELSIAISFSFQVETFSTNFLFISFRTIDHGTRSAENLLHGPLLGFSWPLCRCSISRRGYLPSCLGNLRRRFRPLYLSRTALRAARPAQKFSVGNSLSMHRAPRRGRNFFQTVAGQFLASQRSQRRGGDVTGRRSARRWPRPLSHFSPPNDSLTLAFLIAPGNIARQNRARQIPFPSTHRASPSVKPDPNTCHSEPLRVSTLDFAQRISKFMPDANLEKLSVNSVLRPLCNLVLLSANYRWCDNKGR